MLQQKVKLHKNPTRSTNTYTSSISDLLDINKNNQPVQQISGRKHIEPQIQEEQKQIRRKPSIANISNINLKVISEEEKEQFNNQVKSSPKRNLETLSQKQFLDADEIKMQQAQKLQKDIKQVTEGNFPKFESAEQQQLTRKKQQFYQSQISSLLKNE